LTSTTEGALPTGEADRRIVVCALGVTQIFTWGSSYYLLAVLARPIAAETGWSLTWVIGGLSLGLLVAGIVSPLVGRRIERIGGRPVLAAGAILLAAGLLALAHARGFYAYLGAWIVIGLGMGAGLYDPAFSTLGRIYGQSARSLITAVTLFGGFASTVCWPLTALLDAHFGWRVTCIAYALVQLLFALPIHLWALPREVPATTVSADEIMPPGTEASSGQRRAKGLFVLIATVITVSSVLSTVMSVHLLSLLQARGLALSVAVAFGALVGPSQVAARTVEMFVARFHHPIWTKLASTSLVALGIVLILAGFPVISAALVLYGAGIGLESIARGTLPLAVFGADDYPAIMGRIARPSLVAQAVAPTIAAGLIDASGFNGMLAVLSMIAVGAALLSITLFAILKARSRPSASTQRMRQNG
jgi:predicted MFS family arabinose efflux permease